MVAHPVQLIVAAPADLKLLNEVPGENIIEPIISSLFAYIVKLLFWHVEGEK